MEMSHISVCVLVGFFIHRTLSSDQNVIPSHPSVFSVHLVFNWFLSVHFFSLSPVLCESRANWVIYEYVP